jgi:hypothetical protein
MFSMKIHFTIQNNFPPQGKHMQTRTSTRQYTRPDTKVPPQIPTGAAFHHYPVRLKSVQAFTNWSLGSNVVV